MMRRDLHRLIPLVPLRLTAFTLTQSFMDQLDEDWRRPWLGESTHSERFGCTEQEDLYDSASDSEKEDEEEEEVVMVEEEEGEDGEILQMSH